MKVMIITTYNVYNYGASLQAYALMYYLASKGHDVEIIKYQPSYLSVKYDYKWVNPESKASKHFVTRCIYRAAKYIQRQTTLGRKKAFDLFNHEVLIETPEEYKTFFELKNNPPNADVYICGSDQIWNVFYETGRDPAFYLDFAPQGKVKISYAASFSYLDISQEMRSKIAQFLKSFRQVSVREYHGLDILKSMDLNGTWVLDPTFLLNKIAWDEFAENGHINVEFLNMPYLLIYDFERNSLLKSAALDYAKRNNLKIYSVNDTYPKWYADKNISNAGPYEFVQLVKHSKAFMSNSFHGTVFSIIFKKPFFVFERKRHAVNSRMESLLFLFKEQKRIIKGYDDYIDVRDAVIDWNIIDDIKEKHLGISESFLMEAVGHAEGK